MSPQGKFSLWHGLFSLSLFILSVDAARLDIPCPTDPYANPAQDFCNPLRYIPTSSLTAISFALILAVGLIQSYFSWRTKTRYMLAMVIGCYTFALGLAFRWGLQNDPHSRTIYILYYLFVVLSPCAFIAADYVLLGRMARHLNVAQYLLVPAEKLTIIFVTSDITTFIIQATGGSLSAGTSDPVRLHVSNRIFLAGLILQLISFAVFIALFLTWLWKVYTHEKQVWLKDTGKSWYNDWRALAYALVISCIGILIRSTYRTIELSEGFGGFLSIHEVFFFTLDTLPLFLAVAVYVAMWPGRFVPSPPRKTQKAELSTDAEQNLENGVDSRSVVR